MKNVTKMIVPMLFLAFTFMSTNQSYAQCSNNIVGYNSLGPGMVADINYTVGSCSSFLETLCVYTDDSDLCPGYVAIAQVLVNGTLVATQNITATGSQINFQAPCGSDVHVIVNAFPTIPTFCFAAGYLRFTLRQV